MFHGLKSLFYAAKIRIKMEQTKKMRHFFDAFILVEWYVCQLGHNNYSDIGHDVILDYLNRIYTTATELGSRNGHGP